MSKTVLNCACKEAKDTRGEVNPMFKHKGKKCVCQRVAKSGRVTKIKVDLVAVWEK